MTFLGSDTAELHSNWTALGLRHLSILDTQLLDPDFVRLLRAEEYAVEAVTHLFAAGQLSGEAQSVRAAAQTCPG